MSRIIGGAATWDSALWSAPAGEEPMLATWPNATAASELAALLEDDPSPTEGAAFGPAALGGLRFVVQALDPTLGASAVWDTALWDTAVWASGVGQWHDISARVRGVHWENGADTPGDVANVGSAIVTLDNSDGEASPWATSGEFATLGDRPWLRAGCHVRFGMLSTNPGAVTDVALAAFNAFFTGTIDRIAEDTESGADGWVTLDLIETTTQLGARSTQQRVTAGNALTATILQALEHVGWTYQTSLQVPDDDAAVPTANIDSHESALEGIYEYLLHARHWQIMANGRGQAIVVERLEASSSGLTFSNAPSGVELPIPVDGVETYANLERIINLATASRLYGEQVTFGDGDSILQFGTITDALAFPRLDLMLRDDADVTALLHKVVGAAADDDFGIESMRLDADMDTALMPAVLTYLASVGREAVSFTVRWLHPNGGTLLANVAAEAQVHDITPLGETMKWETTLRLREAI